MYDGLTVLIVDDDEVLQRPWLVMVVKLRFPGIQIVEAGSAGDAYREIDQNPNLVAAIVDLCLPDDHEQVGLDILRYLRHAQPTCMRILVTSLVNERDVRDKSDVEAFVSINHRQSSRKAMLAEALGEALRRKWRNIEFTAVQPAHHVGNRRII